MRFLIQVQTENDQNWKVTVTSDTLQPDEIPSVLLSAQEILGVDYPTHEQLDGLSLNDVHSSLGRIQTRIPGPNDLQVVGQYLFRILIGTSCWTMICRKADAITPNSNIELGLSWDEEAASVFRRLPWEIMHDGHHFLAVDPNRVVAITRLVKGFAPGQNSPTTVQISPKVLFVIGSNHHDPVLRPGAEILGLIRRLETVGLGLHFVSQVRVRATKDDVEKAIRSFQPSIVHFICHGGLDSNGGYIKLMSTEPGVEFDQVRADELFTRLTPNRIPPPLVILNACDTAKASAQKRVVSFAEENACDTAKASAQEGVVSFAEELVVNGVPVVLGMAGEVADSACRFVTRGFYEALLRGKCPQIAVANARRAALQAQGTNSGVTIDWSLLTLFSKELYSLELNQSEADLIKKRRLRAKDYRIISDPHLFCDRVELLATFQQLLEDRGPKVFAIQDPSVNGFKCGKTRLLEEFAAQATEYGHIPFLIYFSDKNIPKDNFDLADRFFNVLSITYKKFGKKVPETSQLDQLACKREVSTGSLNQEVVRSLRGQSLSNLADLSLNSLIIALRADLESLKQTLEKELTEKARIVVLIDGLQLLESASDLVKDWFTVDGLGYPSFKIPTVFTFSNGSNGSTQAISQEIRLYIEPRRNLFEYSALSFFPHPDTDPLPYHQLLLSHSPPLVLNSQMSSEDKTAILKALHLATESGNPDFFMTLSPKLSLKVFFTMGPIQRTFVPATDDNIFLQLFGGKQNA